MGPAPATAPACSPPPDYRIAARRVQDACGAGFAGRAPPGPCPPAGRSPRPAATGKQAKPCPQADLTKPAGQSGMPATAQELRQKTCIPAA